MKKLILGSVLLSVLVVGCTSQKVQTVSNKQDVISQQALNELKNGVSIYFNKNSSQIQSQYNIHLLTAAKALAQNQNFLLELEGHTDNTGSVSTNKRVSLERANSVRNKLVMEYNVNPNQVVTLGSGSAKPIDSNNTAEGRANNRRVSATLKIK